MWAQAAGPHLVGAAHSEGAVAHLEAVQAGTRNVGDGAVCVDCKPVPVRVHQRQHASHTGRVGQGRQAGRGCRAGSNQRSRQAQALAQAALLVTSRPVPHHTSPPTASLRHPSGPSPHYIGSPLAVARVPSLPPLDRLTPCCCPCPCP